MAMFLNEWRVICDGLRGRGRHLLEDGLWSDCELSVGVGEAKTSFRLHRTLLAMASPVFAAEFFEGQEQSSLDDVNPDVFKQLLRYIYTDECRVESVEGACSLARLAHRFRVQAPVRASVVYLGANIKIENVLKIYETAKQINDSDLSAKSLRNLCRKTEQVLNHPSFLDVEVDTLIEIFKRNWLTVDSEMTLVSALIKYSEAQPSSPSNDPHRLLPAVRHLRLLSLTPQEFSKVSTKLTMLAPNETVAILNQILNPDKDAIMPNGLSESTIKRNKISNDEADNSDTDETIDFVDDRELEKISYERIITELKLEISRDAENKAELNKTNAKLENDLRHLTAKSELEKAKSNKTIAKLENDLRDLKAKSELELQSTISKHKAEWTAMVGSNYNFLKIYGEILTEFQNNSLTMLRCTRTVEPVMSYSNSLSCNGIWFKVNADATLLGLQLPTQFLEDSAGKTYEETIRIEVYINDKEFSRLTAFSSQRRLPYNSTWDVLLNTPVKIKKDEERGITVQLLVPGRYPRADSAAGQTDSAGPLTVEWTGTVCVDSGLTRGLLFEK